MTIFNIKIISDNVCPFCYIGKARLDRAISTFKRTVPDAANDTFRTSWHAFYLDPNPAPGSVPVNEALRRKFGASANIDAMHAALAQKGAAEGLNFTFKGRTGSTRDSHRLAQMGLAKGGEELQNKVVHEVMKMYFEEGGDITSRKDLVDAAERAGVVKEEAEAWLEEGKGGAEVDREVEEAYKMGVHGVPKFIINDKYQVSGAEEVEVFLHQFAKAKQAAAAAAA